ncbi:NlpC/P60 family protein [Thioclava indica]|uniref:Peptidase n=1 Tax=Thioclava indica TaxID=1353528 RepID=A0A074JTJ4_9RHOB|nr:NlpC/P60 family protein [Thioclava indica]KEO59190.1 peptidase [Thioclava indica]
MSDDPGARVVTIARDWIGTPYLHQASRRGVGCDCLGLLRGVWRTLYGAEPAALPPYSGDWGEPAGDELLWRAMALYFVPAQGENLGDVALFRMRANGVAKHLGIVSGLAEQGAFIHAYTGHGVVESALTRPWRRRIVARFQFP